MRKPVKLGFSFVCAALCTVPLTASAAKKTVADYKLFAKKLSKDDQILHALDRLTFGPRPGDVGSREEDGAEEVDRPATASGSDSGERGVGGENCSAGIAADVADRRRRRIILRRR